VTARGEGRGADRRRRRRGAGKSSPSPTASTAAFGGRFQALSTRELNAIDGAVMTILRDIGLSEAPEPIRDLFAAGGARITRDGRICLPEALVREAVEAVPRNITLCGQDPVHDLHLHDGRVYTGSGGAAPTVVDLDDGRYRASTLKDLYDAGRVVDALDHAHFFSRSLVAGDLDDPYSLDLNTAFASLASTSKHVVVSASAPEHVADLAEMCYLVAGSEAAFRERPFLSLNVNHVVPPLRFHAESCAVMVAAVRAGIPVLANIFGQLGASSPVTTAGSVAQCAAESLAGVVLAWLACPAAKVIPGPRPMVTDMRTGAMSGGGGEQALATAISIQMMRYYDLPNSTIAGATDSKAADAQAGYEKALNVALAVHSGANLVTQACGMHAGLMGVSFESYVIDDDMLGAILRSATPVKVDGAALAVAAIADVGGDDGDGHFLGRPETYARMKTDFLYPRIADRRPTPQWEADGSPRIEETARQRAKAILAIHFPSHLDMGLRQKLRKRFELNLSEAEMHPHRQIPADEGPR